MLNRPHRLYLLLLVVWVAIILILAPSGWASAATVSIIGGVLAAAYFEQSAKTYARRLLDRVAAGEPGAERLYRARTRSAFGDVAREYVRTLLESKDKRLLPLVVEQLGHPDVQVRELAEDRLVRWGLEAAEPLVEAAVGHRLTGDGAFRVRRLLYRMRSELPPEAKARLEAARYWQDE
ncbi:MAG: hypothetical protein K6T37_03475 [Acidothermus cellulolyticus]|nr:hypothetical protein [Acidothermus cellulolyticus]